MSDDHTREGSVDERSSDYWSPGARLIARTETAPAVRSSGGRSSGLLLATSILLLAALIAVGLWLAALWAQSDDQDDQATEGGAPMLVHHGAGVDGSIA